jgi:hypothetical protein
VKGFTVKLYVMNDEIIVILSKRNLLALLSKVDDPTSAKALSYWDEEDGHLTVVAQPDNIHYADRIPPGPVRDQDEEFILENSGKDSQ